jgi:phytoene synthase
MRALVRDHLAKARATLSSAPPQILPAFLPLALIGPTLRLMDRADYDPFRFLPLAQWRRQWLLWCAARNPKRITAV